jgi:transposase
LIASPYDPAARYSTKRGIAWVGYKVHLAATCEAGLPHLITQVITTPATTPDCVMGPTIQQNLANRDLLPSTHLLDSGYVDAELLVTARTRHQIEVVGPRFGSYSHQRRAGRGYDLSAFAPDWEATRAHCPQGRTSVKWTPGRDVSGDPVMRIRFDRATCHACPARQSCTWAEDAPRQLTVRPQAQHEAILAARQQQETAEFKAQYAQRAGIEGTHVQGIRRCGLRQSWWRAVPLATTRRSPLAALRGAAA